ncbi:SWIM zinc finger family protein [Corynebacterium glucuronolyticum]|uniref:SWIM zinc finger family protein n=1 Tax=Corynebacterium glucuronolyticum TaxID=39791 RepID=UPI00031ED43A|nr:SWIM zinc finger family protein [Corynebacterium glucuronolyticum]
MSHDSSEPPYSANRPGSRRNRRSQDNVIYANFRKNGALDRARALANKYAEAKSASPQNELSQPIARFIMDAVQSNAEPGRFVRGMDYSKQGRVLPNIRLDTGAVHAYVAGSQNEPFDVAIVFPRRSPDEIARLVEILASRPTLLHEGVLEGEVLGIIAARDSSELVYRCTCPDSARVCKHIVAVAHQLALILDDDPKKVFDIRGVDVRELEQSVSASVATLSERRAVESTETFWEGGALPDLPRPRKAPAVSDGDDTFLREAFKAISYTSIDQMRAVSDLEDLYYVLTKDMD